MARIFFLALAFYLVYKLVFDLILPVYKATKHMRKQFSNMQQPMQDGNAQKPQGSGMHSNTTGKPSKAGEYIDFEELK